MAVAAYFLVSSCLSGLTICRNHGSWHQELPTALRTAAMSPSCSLVVVLEGSVISSRVMPESHTAVPDESENSHVT